MQTTRHFSPDFNAWLDRLPDTRVQDACTCDKRFLAWWGLHLSLLQLGSRRQLDYELRDADAPVLANLNRLAQTEQTTLPVHDTLDPFIGHVKLAGWERLRQQCVQRLLRRKVLDAALPALPGAAARPTDTVSPSRPGSEVAGAGRRGCLAGQRIHRERRCRRRQG